MSNTTRATIEQVARENYGKLLALLIHQFRDIELSEDVLQEAILSALKHWMANGIPANPPAWLLQTARRKAIDWLRRGDNFDRKAEQLKMALASEMNVDTSAEFEDMQIPDERLRLIFTCCHPALSERVRITLTLKTLCGLSVQQVARAFVVSETTMAQRLVRARKKIKHAGIPYQVPPAPLLHERLSAVLAVIYFIFNEGYSSSSGDNLIIEGFCDEAIHLAETMLKLLPNETEVWGLLALMLFHKSRFQARTGETGELIDLESQDRALWDKNLIARADKLLSTGLIKGDSGAYLLQAAISAVHVHATCFEQTDWKQIVMLYHRLESQDANPVIKLNMAVALSYAESPEFGLSYLDQNIAPDQLKNYYPYHAAQADMHRRLGHYQQAIDCYQQAIRICNNSVESAYLERKMAVVGLDD